MSPISAARPKAPALNRSTPTLTTPLVIEDNAVTRKSATDFFRLERGAESQAARLSEQFSAANTALLKMLDTRVETRYDGRDVTLEIHSASAVGAVPLFSPQSARLDFGLVVFPRFSWSGIGPMLAQMGWRISPQPLKLPLLKRSERRVPLWVLSLMILARLRDLLQAMQRRFEATSELLSHPRGQVNWTAYATRSIPRAKLTEVPCTFPDLREDRQLKGAIRFSIERHIQALSGQKDFGAFVHRLIDMAQQLLYQVRDAPVYIPSPTTLAQWLQRPFRQKAVLDGMQAIEWTVEERGLAGISDLEGIPWTMPMEKFFEAWAETVFRVVAQRMGARIRVARKRETVHPITWNPTYLGTQKALIPDIWLEWETATLIVDAKYKRHWEELQQSHWAQIEEAVREGHRNDLLQILAYANLPRTDSVTVCLAYPCEAELWESLQQRGRLFHKADITSGARSIKVLLTALPMALSAERIASAIVQFLAAYDE